MSNLKRRAVRSTSWTGLSAIVTTGLEILQYSVLARLLAPEDFGIFALVLIIIGFCDLLCNFGLREALIQRNKPTRDELASLYWFQLMLGVFLFIFVFMAAPWMAFILDSPQLSDLVPVVAFILLVNPLGAQFRAMAQKRLEFRFLMHVEVNTAVVRVAVSIIAAWLWEQGIWSLVWGHLSASLCSSAILMAYGWKGTSHGKPHWHFRWNEIKSYLSFGSYRVGAMSANFFRSRVDQIMIGSLLGTEALGYYSVAYNLILRPTAKINALLVQVAFPVFSLVQNDVSRLKNGFMQMMQFVIALNSPALLGLAAIAPLAIPLLLGNQWYPAVPMIQILALYALVRCLGNAAGSLVMACGRADWEFLWNMIFLFVTPPVIYIGIIVTRELTSFVWFLFGFQIALFFAHYHFFIRRLIGPCLIEYLQVITRPIILSAVMALVVINADLLVDPESRILYLAVQVTLGAIVYVALFWALQRHQVNEVLHYMLEKKPQ